MGWRSQDNYELTNERDFKRLSWRDRRIIQRAGWVAALRSCLPPSWPDISGDRVMADVTYYVALPFGAGDEGAEPREAVECTSANAAIRSAERMAQAEGNIGAVAFSRTGDPGSGEFADAVLLKAFGDVPSDLSEL